jgi:hypothetical protein
MRGDNAARRGEGGVMIWADPEDRWHALLMGASSHTKTSSVLPQSAIAASPELKRELLEAIAEIERGECIELNSQQLERCIVDGEWPWPKESRG